MFLNPPWKQNITHRSSAKNKRSLTRSNLVKQGYFGHTKTIVDCKYGVQSVSLTNTTTKPLCFQAIQI